MDIYTECQFEMAAEKNPNAICIWSRERILQAERSAKNVHGECIKNILDANGTKAPFFQLTMFCAIWLDAHENKAARVNEEKK